MKRYMIEDKHWASVCVDGTVALLEETGGQVAEVEVTHDDGTITPESARRLRVLAAAPEMLSLLEHIERWHSDPRDPISAEVSNQITDVLEYIKTGEEGT